MEKILILLSNRRVWAAIISGVIFVLGMFGVSWSYDTATVVELFTGLGTAIAALVAAILSIHSYLKPKK